MPNRISHLCASLSVSLMFGLTLAAQATPPVECPKIEVSGPAGVTNPGDEFKFRAAIEGTVLSSVVYRWSVSTGSIVQGQGTDRISVAVDWVADAGTTLTATVEIRGLPNGCSNTASEAAAILVEPVHVLVDQFTERIDRISPPRLNAFAQELKKYPSSFGIIFEYFLPRTKRSVIARKIKMTKDLLVKAGVEADRFRVYAIQDAPQVSTSFYRGPRAADNPNP